MPRQGADRPYGSFRRLFAEEEPGEPPPKQSWRDRLSSLRSRSRGAELLAAGAVVALTVVGIVNAVTPPPAQLAQSDVDRSIRDALASATPKPNVAVAAFNTIKDSVVLIKTRNRGETAVQARGSGFLLDSGGTVVTSLHVVKDAIEITVVFADGEETSGTLAETRVDFDIALLDVIASGRKPATLASPKDLRVGDEAIAVGSPLGQRNSLAVGVISKLGSTTPVAWSSDPIGGLIQFDAAMYPENSGGPLVNRRGEVIGVVMVPHTTGMAGMGFAVPIDSAASVSGSNPF
jgi:S1-C subfamily serine protease